MSPKSASQHISIQRTHPRWDLLRFRYVIGMTADGMVAQEAAGASLRRFELVPSAQVIEGEDLLLGTLFGKEFDPRSTVLLEETPKPAVPESGGELKGGWKIEREDTDEVVVSVSVDKPCVLLMTDPYSKGWRARSLTKKAPQNNYEVLPANYAVRGIPLAAGDHIIRIYFRPQSFMMGASISGMAWIGWGIFMFRHRARTNQKDH